MIVHADATPLVETSDSPMQAQIARFTLDLHRALRERNQARDAVRKARIDALMRLVAASEFKDSDTGLHIMRMGHFSALIAAALGCSETYYDDLLYASRMHDVGKIGIPDAVLRKPGPLDADEWATMRRHPEIGAEIIGEHPAGVLQLAREIALAHHEKWDGSGYPQGLAGEAIPLSARIVAIADVFDALTTRRPYKEPWPVQAAMDHIAAQAGQHFDPALVQLFTPLLPQLLEVRARWAD